MAHQLEEHDTMVSASGITPWHGLGTVMPDDGLTLEQALILAELDWTVSLHPVFADTPSGRILIASRKAVVRDDVQVGLGVVGLQWRPLQNVEGFDLLGTLMEMGEVKIETAGSLRNGAIVWALARMPEDIVVAGDRIVPYVLFSNGHDGTRSVRFQTTPIRVVCANTLALADTMTVTEWRGRHTSNMDGRIAEAREALGLMSKRYEGFELEVQKLVDQKVTDDAFFAIVANVLPDDESMVEWGREKRAEKRGLIEGLWTEAGEQNGWGALQAINSAELHHLDNNQDEKPEAFALRALRGKAHPLTDQAHKLLVAAR